MRWTLLGATLCLVATSCGGKTDYDGSGVGPDDSANGLNDRCERPLSLELGNGGIVILGDTSVGTNEFSTLTCNSPNVAFTFDQAQLYYRFELVAHERYRLLLKPTFYGFIYAFAERTACSPAAIEAACSSEGASGDVSPIANPSTETLLELVPAQTEAYVVVVDGDTSEGPFALEVEQIDG